MNYEGGLRSLVAVGLAVAQEESRIAVLLPEANGRGQLARLTPNVALQAGQYWLSQAGCSLFFAPHLPVRPERSSALAKLQCILGGRYTAEGCEAGSFRVVGRTVELYR